MDLITEMQTLRDRIQMLRQNRRTEIDQRMDECFKIITANFEAMILYVESTKALELAECP